MAGDVAGVAVVGNDFSDPQVIAKQQQSREMLEGTLIQAMMLSTLYSSKQP